MVDSPPTPQIPRSEISSIHQEMMDHLIAMIHGITREEGRIRTMIPFLTIVRNTQPTPPIPVVSTPAFCLILQGAKRLHVGPEIIDCPPGTFLASVIDMPISGQIIGSSWKSPYLGARIDFTIQEITSVVMEAGITIPPQRETLNKGTFIGKSNTDLLDQFIRLLKLLDKPREAPFRSALIKREMIFNLLSGDYGHLFFQQVFFDQQADGIGKAIGWIGENYARSFTVEELAKATNMSVSGLHHKFKAITTMGPVQYQKQLRLQEARRLMLSGVMDATTAALEVGYESPSQFSREYRRLFGLPPLQDIKALRNLPGAVTFASSEMRT